MKKIGLIFMTVFLIFVQPVYANDKQTNNIEEIKNFKYPISLNFHSLKFEGVNKTRIYPIIYKGKVYIPLKSFLEAVGKEISFDKDKKIINIFGFKDPYLYIYGGKYEELDEYKTLNEYKNIKELKDYKIFIDNEEIKYINNYPLIVEENIYFPLELIYGNLISTYKVFNYGVNDFEIELFFENDSIPKEQQKISNLLFNMYVKLDEFYSINILEDLQKNVEELKILNKELIDFLNKNKINLPNKYLSAFEKNIKNIDNMLKEYSIIIENNDFSNEDKLLLRLNTELSNTIYRLKALNLLNINLFGDNEQKYIALLYLEYLQLVEMNTNEVEMSGKMLDNYRKLTGNQIYVLNDMYKISETFYSQEENWDLNFNEQLSQIINGFNLLYNNLLELKNIKQDKQIFDKSEVLEISQKQDKIYNLDKEIEQFVNEEFFKHLNEQFKIRTSFWKL